MNEDIGFRANGMKVQLHERYQVIRLIGKLFIDKLPIKY
jgi:hypothetical protein